MRSRVLRRNSADTPLTAFSWWAARRLRWPVPEFSDLLAIYLVAIGSHIFLDVITNLTAATLEGCGAARDETKRDNPRLLCGEGAWSVPRQTLERGLKGLVVDRILRFPPSQR